MFMRIVTQVNGLLTGLFTTAYTWVKAQLLLLVSKLRVSISQAYLNVVSQLRRHLQLVLTMLKSNPLVVGLIKAVQSIKAALISVKVNLIRIGSLLQTIVRTTPPPAPIAHKRKKGKPVGLTKSARLRTKEKIIVPTPTAHLLTPAGLKSQGRVKRLLQRVKAMLKVGV
jgi:hypothetical protein